jgi:hypothetical protein
LCEGFTTSPLLKISIEKGNMKTIRVNTVVENDACDESREYTFKTGRPLSATAYLDPKKTSNVWANHYATDDTWTISIGNVTVHDIGQKDMLNLIKVIQEETEKIDVTSNDNT